MPFLLQLIKLLMVGIIEGITEWLPISSTGHIILVNKILPLNMSDEFGEIFTVVIQLGAICAVPILFRDRLYPFSKDKTDVSRASVTALWKKVLLASFPAALVGFLFDDLLDKYFYNDTVVAISLIVYGIAFLIVERMNKGKNSRFDSVYSLSYSDALHIGLFQILSLIPGTSRSGVTILGGLILGVGRAAASEFSFFMAIPIMMGASALKLVKLFASGSMVSNYEWILLGAGMLISFFVSLLTIKYLMDFVKRHTFIPFGIYRIALGSLVLIIL